MPRLVLSLDGVVLREVGLTKDRTTIGRRSHNDIVIDNLAVSGEHAVIYSSGGEVYLEDLGSTNGTTVNGQPIKKHLLQSGDAVEIGKYRLKFLADGASGTEGEVDIDTSQPLKREFYGPGPATIQIRQPGSGEDSPAAASIKILNGANEGRELQLVKALTTIGRPATRSPSSPAARPAISSPTSKAKCSRPSTARTSARPRTRSRTRTSSNSPACGWSS